jgi:hypothetical protein
MVEVVVRVAVGVMAVGVMEEGVVVWTLQAWCKVAWEWQRKLQRKQCMPAATNPLL